MGANGYAKPQVLIETAEVAERPNDRSLRLIEVDVDTSAYEQGHLAGAVGGNWQKDLQRHPVRDIPTKEEWEVLRLDQASPTTPRSCSTATTTTGSPPSPIGSSSSTATRTSA